MKALFRLVDVDCDGFAVEKEMKKLKSKLGWACPLLKERMNYDEFVQYVERFLGIMDRDHEKLLSEAFKQYDLNGDGQITKEEVIQVTRNAPEL